MGPEMQDRMGPQVLAQIAVEGGEGVGRGEAVLEQEPHRIALVAEGRLDADEDIAEGGTQHEDRAAVALLAARRRAPLRLDLGQMRLVADMLVGRDAGMDIGIRAEALGIAVDDPLAQLVHRGRQLDRIALGLERAERVVKRFEHAQIGRGADRAAIGREVEQDDREAALGGRGAAQLDQPGDPRRQHAGALVVEALVARPIGGGLVAAAAEHHRASRAIQLRDRDHHGRLDRGQAARRALPLLERLELQRMGGEVGHIQAGQHRFGGAGIVVGGAADQGEAGQ